jgi:SAM-dependent methyltransferase
MRVCPVCRTAIAGEEWACAACGFTAPVEDGIPLLAPDERGDGKGFDPASFALLADLEAESFWFQERNALIAWALDRYFPHAASLLEIGCGTGFVMQGLRASRPGLELAGAELYPEGLHVARERVPEAEFLQLDATRMPYEDHWDAVGAFDVLEHIEDDEAVLAGMKQGVKPGGGILITVPHHPSLWSKADDYAHHVRRYTRAELVGKVERAGFRIDRVTPFVSVLLPLMYVSRWRERKAVSEFDPVREHAAAARVKPLGKVLAAERALIRRGKNFPAGGSLLLIGRRP